MRMLALTVITAAAFATAGTASAQDYRVAYGDLDLATVEGSAAFDARVRQTANRACRGVSPLSEAQCRLRFRDEALRQLPAGRRDDYARARGNRVLAMVPVIYG